VQIRVRGRWVRLQKSRQEKTGGRHACSIVDAAASGTQQQQTAACYQPHNFPLYFHYTLSINSSMALATAISRATILLAGCLGICAGISEALAAPAAVGTGLAAYAMKSFQNAQARYQQAPGEAAAAWQFGRACFDLAEFATNNTQRASLANLGIAACQRAMARESNSAPAHYYLGLNLGQLARTVALGALKLVDQMEREFIRAHDLDERFDCAGPDRSLGLLYLDAPTIVSIGSRTRAREHLKRAVELAPQYPENRLSLIEAYLKWGERTSANRELQGLEAAWPAARTNFVGEAWAASWADWDPRLKKLKKKIEEPPKALGAPREK
jgi:tetratricopeptide (TPR) repeat protein